MDLFVYKLSTEYEIDELKKSSRYKSGEALTQEIKHVVGKDRIITDGPFAESKELIGGYFVVLAEDFNDAINISKGCPILNLNGSVEIREVQIMNL